MALGVASRAIHARTRILGALVHGRWVHATRPVFKKPIRFDNSPTPATATATATAPSHPSIFDAVKTSGTRSESSFKLVVGGYGVPRDKPFASVIGSPHGVSQCGEDAFFIRSDALGVADGIGGWHEVPGANAALFAYDLMRFTAEVSLVFLSCGSDVWKEVDRYGLASDDVPLDMTMADDPLRMLQTSIARIPKDLVGGSTVLLALLRHRALKVSC